MNTWGKRFVAIVVLFIVSIGGMYACTARQTVPAGHVGVKVFLYGGDKGVEAKVLGTGRYWIGWYEELYLFPTFTQTKTWDGDDAFTFQDVDGLTISAGVGTTYEVDKSKAALLFQEYRLGIEEITDTVIRAKIRDALVRLASTRKVDVIYGTGKSQLLDEALSLVQRQMAPVGINVKSLYWAGSMGLPRLVLQSLNSKIQQTQIAGQRENMLRTAEANAKIKRTNAQANADAVLIEARGQADANRLLAQSITPELVRYRTIQKWKGDVPRVTSGATPIIDLRN